MACFGLILSTVGMDTFTSQSRLTFGVTALLDGFELVYVTMGLFGLGEVFINLDQAVNTDIARVVDTKFKNLLPNRQDWKDSAKPMARGTLVGFFLGVLPGFGPAISSFISYAIEKRFSKHPERFGTGTIEGVAGPESANNSASSGTFIPLLGLGIPVNPSTAILVGALMILGLQPGPLLISDRPDVFWGVIASMYSGNVMLLILNLPLIGIWVQILKIPYSILYVLIVLFCQIGAYSVNNNVYNVLIMNIFGLFGYLLKRYSFEGAPMIMALVLGGMFETSLRRSLMMADGDATIFLSRPLSLAFLLIALVLLISPFFTRERIGKKAIEMKEE